MPARYLYKKFFQRIVQINDTPESLALGTALGIFIAMTPTVGIQMVLVLVLHTLLRANRIAGLIMVYISNPLTMIPIYWLDYVFGTWVMRLEPVTEARFEEVFVNFVEHFRNMEFLSALGEMNQHIILPTFVGGTLLGLLLAVPSYPFTLRLIRSHQRRKAHRQALLRARDLQREERARVRQKNLEAAEPGEQNSGTALSEARGRTPDHRGRDTANQETESKGGTSS